MDKYVANGKTFKIYIDRNKILETVAGLARRINTDYEGKQPVFVFVLKGSMFFGTDLMKNINLDCQLMTVDAKSYGNGMVSSGTVDINSSNLDLKDKDVILVEDIVDSGITLATLKNVLKKQEPASVEIASLLSKPALRQVAIDVKYVGIEIPPVFVIGYGLDYAEHGRQLPDIYALDGEA
jgi:hypoxanthine phosphoribosyltransferase